MSSIASSFEGKWSDCKFSRYHVVFDEVKLGFLGATGIIYDYRPSYDVYD